MFVALFYSGFFFLFLFFFFTLAGGKAFPVSVKHIHGLLFLRSHGERMAPPTSTYFVTVLESLWKNRDLRGTSTEGRGGETMAVPTGSWPSTGWASPAKVEALWRTAC